MNGTNILFFSTTSLPLDPPLSYRTCCCTGYLSNPGGVCCMDLGKSKPVPAPKPPSEYDELAKKIKDLQDEVDRLRRERPFVPHPAPWVQPWPPYTPPPRIWYDKNTTSVTCKQGGDVVVYSS